MVGVFKQVKLKNVKKHDLFVIRVSNKNDQEQLVNARPCENCLNMMKKIGINRVYYSDDDGNIISENVKDMISLHSSSVIIKIHTKIINNQTIYKFWENQIKNKLPKYVKQNNFDKFIKYDFKSLMPDFNFIIFENNNIKTVKFINSNNQIINSIIIL